MRLFTKIVLFGVIACSVQDAAAQGWTREKGHGYFQLSARGFRSSTYHEPGGTTVDIPTLGDYVASFYGEYGVSSRITAIIDAPLFERITRNELIGRTTGFVFTEGDAVTGIADVVVGARFGIASIGQTAFSGSVLLGIPLGDATHPGGLWTGDGEFNQIISAEAGHSLYPIPAYVSASIGFNQRSEGFSDEINFAVKGGYSITNRFILSGRIRGVEPLRNGKSDVGGQGGFGGNEVRYLLYGIEAAFEVIDNAGIRASVDTATRKQNVLSGVVFGVGFYLER